MSTFSKKSIIFSSLILLCLLSTAFTEDANANSTETDSEKALRKERKKQAEERRAERISAELEQGPKYVNTTLEKVGSLLYVTKETADDLILNSDILVLVFYNPKESKESLLKEYAASVLHIRPEAAVGFVNVIEQAELAKKHTVRYTPMLKAWGKGIPNTQLQTENTITPRSIESIVATIGKPARPNYKDTTNNLERYAERAQNDMFHLVCLCENGSAEENLAKEFQSIRNHVHDVHYFDATQEEFRANFSASKNPLNQIIIVNNYYQTKNLVPSSSMGSPKQLYDFIMHSKWQGTVVDLYSYKAEDLKTEIEPYMLYKVPIKDGESRLNDIKQTLEALAKEKDFDLGRIFITKATEPHSRTHKSISQAPATKDQVFIIENGYYPAYANIFTMQNEVKSQANIFEFYKQYLSGELETQSRKSQALPDPAQMKGVQIITRDTYWSFIDNPKKDTVIYCYSGKREFDKKIDHMSKAQERMASNPNVQFGIINMQQNDISDMVRLGSGSQIVLHPAGSPKDLRTLPDAKIVSQDTILSFIKGATTQKWIVPGPRIQDSL